MYANIPLQEISSNTTSFGCLVMNASFIWSKIPWQTGQLMDSTQLAEAGIREAEHEELRHPRRQNIGSILRSRFVKFQVPLAT